ncbi:MAG: DNA polymerase III subunit [Erysipelotrichaceae bacterium]
MIISNELQKNQPVAFKLLQNSLEGRQLSQCYLFNCSSKVDALKYAKWLIASMVCKQPIDYVACEDCLDCSRMFNEQYSDLYIIDGSTSSIKKDEILALQNKLSRTPIESLGKKFYIINLLENANEVGQNSLLKFLEEPNDDKTFGIIITNQKSLILPTIISRCIEVNFSNEGSKEILAKAINNNLDFAKSMIISNIADSYDVFSEIYENDTFNLALQLFEENVNEDFIDSLYNISQQGLTSKDKNKNFVYYYINIYVCFLKSLNNYDNDDWFKSLIDHYRYGHKQDQMLKVLLDNKDKLRINCNVDLIIDEIFYQFMEVNK